jgi:NO-binding membrane sensor protein with MHYT domain
MLRVLMCLGTEHDPKLVLLAVIVCVLGSWIAIRLLLRARAAELLTVRLQWSLLAGIAGGAAVWTTHFVAMLGYAPGVATGFDPAGTIASVFVGIGALIVGFGLASSKARFVPEIGGAVIGAGVVAMHYTGMEAFKAEGSIFWDTTYVAASVVMAVAFGVLAIHLSIRQTSLSRYAGVGALVFAIAALHFTGMAALNIVPDFFTILPRETTSHTTIAIAVSGVTLLVLGPAFTSYLIDRRRNQEAQRARSASEQRIHYLAHFDALTGLPNRVAFQQRLDHTLAAACESAASFASTSIGSKRSTISSATRRVIARCSRRRSCLKQNSKAPNILPVSAATNFSHFKPAAPSRKAPSNLLNGCTQRSRSRC